MLTAAICIGGMVGAWTRFRLSGWVHARAGSAFPWGTLIVNITGSFLLGCALPVLDRMAAAPQVQAVVATGVLGGFTTFSTFAYEAVMLVGDGEHARALLYIGASVACGLVSIAAGVLIATTLI